MTSPAGIRIIECMIHLHLDPLGGLAGDMFAACVLAAFPHLEDAVARAVHAAAAVPCRSVPHQDGVLAGRRFLVPVEGGAAPVHVATDGHDHGHGHGHGHHPHDGADPAHHHDAPTHVHRAWSDLRAHLQGCGLEHRVRERATAIFAVLAEAEARVHGTTPDRVSFHEVGMLDSVADIVAAAVLIEGSGAASWSVAPLPLGSGRIRTAHGVMPVPAPATALLLQGFDTIEDGIGGERVTPTGAAILAHLRRDGLLGERRAGRVCGSGVGFGTRRLPGISNCVRLLAIACAPEAASGRAPPAGHRELAVVSFEVDDQSGEDLAAGLERVRAVPGVHDVLQMMAIGKKGRMAAHVQVLAAPDALDAVTAACFSETTTIGLRTHTVRGQALARRSASATVDGAELSVKLVRRPDGGETGKAEADHVLGLATHAARDARRRRAVAQVLDEAAGEGAP